ncbi:hypothetical protein HID58_044776 [Brassica napus]|uniref:Tyrosyl-tRNA synthetase n=2 Tax=Brassica TaxID=3705 RepID=A0ABQ8BLQ5_BRANA|nr:hypothetical protein HID58_044776 [Brassica napus]
MKKNILTMAVRDGALLNDTACKIRDPSREERKKEWEQRRSSYCGFDPTAESLHLGNLLGIIVLSWFQRCGHQAVGLIGDPSGKSLERPELDALTLEKNIAGIKNILVKILGGNARLLCDFLITTMLDFLKNVGRFARVGQMMAKESVKKRLESEQAGTDLIRKILQTEEDGAVWLSPSMLSPYKFYQYFFSQMRKPGYVPNTAQMKLAEEVTRFAHGEEGLKEAMKATEALRPGAETKLDWNLIERGLFESKSAARRLLKQGGVYMNNERVDDENKRVEVGT